MRRFFSKTAQASVAYADMPGEAGVILFIHGLGCSGLHDYSEVASQPALATHRSATRLVEGGANSWRMQLAGFTFPRLYLIGERSLPDPETDRLPKIGVSVEILPDADHNMANHKAEELATAIARQLRRLPSESDATA